jgi:hypothetical protein
MANIQPPLELKTRPWFCLGHGAKAIMLVFFPWHLFNVFVGNCDIDFFIFCHHFCIMRPKYLKFERDQNATDKNSNGINERAK